MDKDFSALFWDFMKAHLLEINHSLELIHAFPLELDPKESKKLTGSLHLFTSFVERLQRQFYPNIPWDLEKEQWSLIREAMRPKEGENELSYPYLERLTQHKSAYLLKKFQLQKTLDALEEALIVNPSLKPYLSPRHVWCLKVKQALKALL